MFTFFNCAPTQREKKSENDYADKKKSKDFFVICFSFEKKIETQNSKQKQGSYIFVIAEFRLQLISLFFLLFKKKREKNDAIKEFHGAAAAAKKMHVGTQN
jgi:hypothetical protein